MRTLKAPDPDVMPGWPYSRTRLRDINEEMADGCLQEIGETLEPLPCMHGPKHGDSVPAMFYRERMLCVMNYLRKCVIDAGGTDPWGYLKPVKSSLDEGKESR